MAQRFPRAHRRRTDPRVGAFRTDAPLQPPLPPLLSHRRRSHGERCAEELTTAAVKAALNEWAAAGVLFLTLSGGEPLLRKDFADIYRYARELGLVVTVFTNGTRLTDAIADLFRELPPRKVEISLYGATAATHDAITGIPGSHAAAWAGIRRLLANGTRASSKRF